MTIARKFAVADLTKTNYSDIDYRFVPEYEANLVTSKIENLYGTRNLHAPVLDLDIPHRLVPSSTAGHSHLYLDVQCSWGPYQDFLDACARIGILEDGYVQASANRGFTAVRKPGIYKTTGDTQS